MTKMEWLEQVYQTHGWDYGTPPPLSLAEQAEGIVADLNQLFNALPPAVQKTTTATAARDAVRNELGEPLTERKIESGRQALSGVGARFEQAKSEVKLRREQLTGVIEKQAEELEKGKASIVGPGTFLPPGDPAVTGVTEAVAAVEKVTTSSAYNPEGDDLDACQKATEEAAGLLLALGQAAGAVLPALKEEKTHRQNVLNDLKSKTEPVTQAAARLKPKLVRYANTVVLGQSLDAAVKNLTDAVAADELTPGLIAAHAPRATFEEKVKTAEGFVEPLANEIKTTTEAWDKEVVAREEALKKLDEQFAGKKTAFETVAKKIAELKVEAVPGDDREFAAREKEFKQTRAEALGKTPDTYAEFTKKLDGVIEAQEKMNDRLENRHDGLVAGKKLKGLEENRKKSLADITHKDKFPNSKVGLEFAASEKAVGDELEAGRGKEALKKAQEYEATLGKVKDLLEKFRSTYAGYIGGGGKNKLGGPFKPLANSIEKVLTEVKNSTDVTFAALEKRIKDADTLIGAGRRLGERFDVVVQDYLVVERGLKDEKKRKALQNTKREAQDFADAKSDPTLKAGFGLLDALLKAIEESDTDYFRSVTTKKALDDLPEGDAKTRLKEDLNRHAEKGRTEKAGYAAVSEEIKQVEQRVGWVKELNAAVKKIESEAGGVSKFEGYVGVVGGVLAPLLEGARSKLMEEWDYEKVEPDLTAAEQVVAEATKVGEKLNDAIGSYTTAVKGRAGGPNDCLAAARQGVFNKTKAKAWPEAVSAATDLKGVAAAVTDYKKAYATAEGQRTAAAAKIGHPNLKKVKDAAQTFFDAATKTAEANRAADPKPYTDATLALGALTDVYVGMTAYAADYLKRDKALLGVKGLYPPGDEEAKQKDLELVGTLARLAKGADDNTEAKRQPYDDAALGLAKIDQGLAELAGPRKEAVKKHMLEKVKGKKAEKAMTAVYGLGGGLDAMADLFLKYGEAGVQQFLTDLDGTEDTADPNKTNSAAGLIALHQAVGADGITTLEANLGGRGRMKSLIGADGGTRILSGLHDKFQDDPTKIKEMMDTGFAGSDKALKDMAKVVCGGDPVKFLSVVGEFPPGELGEVITALGADDSGTKLAYLVQSKYGGDVKKLKTKLYDTIKYSAPLGNGGEAVRKKMLKAAPNFKLTPPPNNPPRPNVPVGQNARGLKVNQSKHLKHFLTRHTPTHFDPDTRDKENTQWPPDTTPDDVKTYLEEAIKEANALNNQKETKTGGYFKQHVPLTDRGVWVRVGYYKDSKEISQFFPIPAAKMTAKKANMAEVAFNDIQEEMASPPLALEEFDTATMKTIGDALKP